MRVKVCYCVSAVEMSSVGAARLGATIKERVRSDAKTEVEMCMTQRSQLTCASKIFLSRNYRRSTYMESMDIYMVR